MSITSVFFTDIAKTMLPTNMYCCSLAGGVKKFFFDVLIYSLNNLLFNNDQQFTYNYNPVSLVYFSLKSISSLFSISILNISYYFIFYSILFSY